MVYGAWTQQKRIQNSVKQLFANIVNDFKPLTIFSQSAILDAWQGSEYASAQGQWSREQPQEMFHKKGVLKNFAKFTEKNLNRSLFQ